MLCGVMERWVEVGLALATVLLVTSTRGLLQTMRRWAKSKLRIAREVASTSEELARLIDTSWVDEYEPGERELLAGTEAERRVDQGVVAQLARLEHLVASGFEEQARSSRKAMWLSAAIGFALGIAASLIASFIWDSIGN
jgi:hypothetical protein